MTPHVASIALLLGFAVALLVGVTSAGGGSLLTPGLVLGLGLPPGVAIGADLIGCAVMKAVCTLVYARRREVDWRLTARLAAGSVPCALAAGWLGARLPGGARDGVLRLALGFALLVTGGGTLLYALCRRAAPPAARTGLSATIAAGSIVGLIAGMTSVGGGGLLLGFLAIFHPMATRRMVGTDLAHATGLMIAGAVAHGAFGQIDWRLAAALSAGAMPGAALGALGAERLPERWLRRGLAVAPCVAAAALLVTR